MYIGSWKIDDTVTFTVNTHTAATGAGTDADAVPAYHVYEDETTNPILTGTMALLNGNNTVGFYSEQITLSAANGFEKGKSYNIYIAATVAGIAATTNRFLQIEAEVDANRLNWANVDNQNTQVFLSGTKVRYNPDWDAEINDVLTNYGVSGVPTVDDVAAVAGQVWDEALSSHLTPGSAGHTLASRMPTGTVLVGDKTGFSLSTPQAFDLIGNITGTITNVLNVVNPVGISTGTFLDAIADKVWDEALSGHAAVGSAGLALSNAGAAGDPWSTALPGSYVAGQAGHILASRMPTGTVIVGTNNDKTGYSLSSPQSYDLIGNISGTITNVINVVNPVVAGVVTGSVLGNVNGSVGSVVAPVGISTGSFINAIADAVWDEQLSGHQAAGSAGNALSAAGSAGDPWSTPLPGSYTAGQAGHILASRMPTGSVVVGTNNDKTGYSLSTPQSFDLIGNVSGTMTNVLNVINPVVAGVVTGSVLGNVNGSVASVTSPVGISTGSFIFAIADQVWDETLSQHLVAGSAGSALNGAGAAGDPWQTALPGSYVSGQAGHILASRMPTGTVIVGTNNDKTGYSLSSPQNFDNVGNTSGTFVGNITGNVSGSVGSLTDITTALANKIADFIWRRNYANIRASSDGDSVVFRSPLGMLAKLVNKWAISGTTLTVKHEDDTTTIGTQTLTGTAGADPITTVDTD